MKRFLCLMIGLSLLLCGCVSDPLQKEKDPTLAPTLPTAAPPVAVPTEPEEIVSTEPASLVRDVIFDRCYGDGQEYGILTAYDEQGNVVWTYQTAAYLVMQLDCVSDVGRNGGIYYIVENGKILAFDVETGALLWENGDFGGTPANTGCAAFDEAGNLYICGFFGPDLFAVDVGGNTLGCIDYLNNDYYWACGLTLTENWISVQLDGGPYGDTEVPYTACVHVNRLTGVSLSLSQAMEQVLQFYNTTAGAGGTFVVFDDECYEKDDYYVLTVRYQFSDAEADQILANGGTPQANIFVATVKVDKETGYIFPEAY